MGCRREWGISFVGLIFDFLILILILVFWNFCF